MRNLLMIGLAAGFFGCADKKENANETDAGSIAEAGPTVDTGPGGADTGPGGTDAGALPNALSCEEPFIACGGTLAGTYTFESSCFDGELTAEDVRGKLPAPLNACDDMSLARVQDVSGSVTFEEGSSVTRELNSIVTYTLTIPKSCVKDSCDNVPEIRPDGDDDFSVADPGGDSCVATVVHTEGRTGTFTDISLVKGVGTLRGDKSEWLFTYCVDEDGVTIREDREGGMRFRAVPVE